MIPIVRGYLRRTKAEGVQIAENAEVSIQIVTAFDIEHGCHLAFGANPVNISGIQRKLDLSSVFMDLSKRMIDAT